MLDVGRRPVRYINKLIISYEALARGEAGVKLPAPKDVGGQLAVQVWPITSGDKKNILVPDAQVIAAQTLSFMMRHTLCRVRVIRPS